MIICELNLGGSHGLGAEKGEKKNLRLVGLHELLV